MGIEGYDWNVMERCVAVEAYGVNARKEGISPGELRKAECTLSTRYLVVGRVWKLSGFSFACVRLISLPFNLVPVSFGLASTSPSSIVHRPSFITFAHRH